MESRARVGVLVNDDRPRKCPASRNNRAGSTQCPDHIRELTLLAASASTRRFCMVHGKIAEHGKWPEVSISPADIWTLGGSLARGVHAVQKTPSMAYGQPMVHGASDTSKGTVT